jgi:heptosyltransferase-2
MKKKPKRRSARRTKARAFTIPDCRKFTGYKPCYPGTRCYENCADPDPIGTRILLINLDAMGNVLVTTSILPALKRKYPISHVSWITLKNTFPLLQNNQFLDRVYVWEPESWLILQQMKFDVVLNVDKSRRSGALAMAVNGTTKLGFGMDENGVIVPLNKEAEENYILGLDDNLKFRVNQKTVPQLLCEQFGLDYRREEYTFSLSPEEQKFCREYMRKNGLSGDGVAGRPFVVGFNTGCSELFPNKKLTVEQHVDLINSLAVLPGVRLVLLGGPEDTLRNAEIVRRVGERVHSTPTTNGVREGLCYINMCDSVISGDSFGMHGAIALKKHVLVWFGVSCHAEIELFGRGVKFLPDGLECSPCWKRECPNNLECIDMVDLGGVVREVVKEKEKRQTAEPQVRVRG